MGEECNNIDGPGSSPACIDPAGHSGQHCNAFGVKWGRKRGQSQEAESLRDLLAVVAESKAKIRRLAVGDIEIEFGPLEPETGGPQPAEEHPTITALKDLFPNGLGVPR